MSDCFLEQGRQRSGEVDGGAAADASVRNPVSPQIEQGESEGQYVSTPKADGLEKEKNKEEEEEGVFAENDNVIRKMSRGIDVRQSMLNAKGFLDDIPTDTPNSFSPTGARSGWRASITSPKGSASVASTPPPLSLSLSEKQEERADSKLLEIWLQFIGMSAAAKGEVLNRMGFARTSSNNQLSSLEDSMNELKLSLMERRSSTIDLKRAMDDATMLAIPPGLSPPTSPLSSPQTAPHKSKQAALSSFHFPPGLKMYQSPGRARAQTCFVASNSTTSDTGQRRSSRLTQGNEDPEYVAVSVQLPPSEPKAATASSSCVTSSPKDEALQETTISLAVLDSTTCGELLAKALEYCQRLEERDLFNQGNSVFGLYSSRLSTFLDFSSPLSTYGFTSEKKEQLEMKAYKPAEHSGAPSPAELLQIVTLALENDKVGRQPIHILVSDLTSELKLLQSMWKKKLVDIDSTDKRGKTPLMYAVAHHNYPVAQWLVTHMRGDLNRRDLRGSSALHCAFDLTREAAESDAVYNASAMTDLLQQMVSSGASLYARDNEGNMPVHSAAAGGYTDALQFFVKRQNVNPNLRNFTGHTVLHCAVLSEEKATVEATVELGAYSHFASSFAELPIHVASKLERPDMFSGLVEAKSNREQSIMDAVVKDDVERLKKQLSQSAMDNSLHRGRDIVNLAAQWACALSRVRCARFLMDHTAFLTTFRHPVSGLTHAHILASALWGISYQVGDLFLDLCKRKGTDLNAKSPRGETPLHFAALSENLCCLRLLLQLGAFTNTVNGQGETELHYAVMTGNLSIVSALTKAGSFPSIRNAFGETPATLAKDCGVSRIWQLLQRHLRESHMMSLPSSGAGKQFFTQHNAVKVTHIRVQLAHTTSPHSSQSDGSRLSGEDRERSASVLGAGVQPLSDALANAARSRKPWLRCTVQHRIPSKQVEISTPVQQIGDYSAQWDVLETFLYRKGETFYRDMEVHIYNCRSAIDVKQPLGLSGACVSDGLGQRLGVGSVLLDIMKEEDQVLVVPLIGPQGKIGEAHISLMFEVLSDRFHRDLKRKYVAYDVLRGAKDIKKRSGEKRMGRAMWALGYRPRYPVVIVPGLASSALEVGNIQTSLVFGESNA